MTKWIAKIKLPAAVLCTNDHRTIALTRACRDAHLRMPQDVAIMGVDNDPLVTTLNDPLISSVDLDGQAIGRTALDALLGRAAGRSRKGRTILIPPRGVVARTSTDYFATTDEEVSAAIDRIRQNLSRPFDVADLMEVTPLSRRSLERRFQDALGRSPAQVIRHMRVERACTLLAETDLKLAGIASRLGFRNLRHFADVFRQVQGETPTTYRQRFRDLRV